MCIPNTCIPIPPFQHKALVQYQAAGRAGYKIGGENFKGTAPIEKFVDEIFIAADTDPAADVVGQVVEIFTVPNGGTYAVLFIPAAYDDLIWLVTDGDLNALSLTHASTPEFGHDRVIPYEVSLCAKPARPHSYICYVCATSYFKVAEYKRLLVEGGIPDGSWHRTKPAYIMAASATAATPMAVEPVVAPTPETAPPTAAGGVKDIVMGIDDELKRNMMIAHMGAMVAQSETLSKTVEELRVQAAEAQAARDAMQKQLTETKADASMDRRAQACSMQVYKDQLTKLRRNITAPLCQAYQITEQETNEVFGDAPGTPESDGRKFEVLQRYLTACNMQFMQGKAEQVLQTEGTAKRSAEVAQAEAARIFAASDAAFRSQTSAPPAMQIQQVGGGAGSADASFSTPSAGKAPRSDQDVASDRIFAAVSGMQHTAPLYM
jgi:hypothetical protein